jgi:hypothetical protein
VVGIFRSGCNLFPLARLLRRHKRRKCVVLPFVVWWIVPATHSMCGPAIEERVAAEPGLWAAHRLEDGVAVVRPGAQGIELVPFKNRTIDKKSPQTAGIVNHSTRGGK